MKKALKLMGVLTLLFSLFANIGFSALEVVHAADTATVTLHKKMMTEMPDALLQNTGDLDSRFDAYENYTDGITFTYYDVSAEFYTARANGDTIADALDAVKGLDPVLDNLTEAGSVTTDNTGSASIVLDKYDQSGRHKVYVIVETAKAGVTAAANMLLMFPVYRMNADGTYTDVELEDIHLYPKNIVSKGDLEVVKLGTADEALLNGAEFMIQSTTTNRYLSGVANGYFTWSDDVNAAAKFLTGRNYGIGAVAITDVVGAAGILNVSGLIPGSYTLIETDAPDNAAIIDSENNMAFTIVSGATAATRLTVLNDTILMDKDIVGEKRDYNVGELIPYTLNINIPVGMGDQLANGDYKHPSLIITDVPDAGLTFNNIVEIKAGDTVIPLADVTLDTSGNGFVLTILANHLALEAGEGLSITYNMYLDGSAAPDLAYANTATVTTSLITDADDGPDVFTGGKRFIKKDKDAENHNLAGATFVVRNSDDANALYLAIGANNAISWVADVADAEKFITAADGIIDIKGLDYGTYYLEEIVAPADYVLLEDRILFEIAAGTYGVPTDLVNPAVVVNIRKGRLPSTGGNGIVGVVGLGLVLITTTGGYYLKRRRDA